MKNVNIAPISFPMQFLGKKWTIEILILLMTGRKRFSDLLEANQNLSGKVLADRLKELYDYRLIDKIVVNMIPLKVMYRITPKGRALEPIFIELAKFSISFFKKELLEQNDVKETNLQNFLSETF